MTWNYHNQHTLVSFSFLTGFHVSGSEGSTDSSTLLLDVSYSSVGKSMSCRSRRKDGFRQVRSLFSKS